MNIIYPGHLFTASVAWIVAFSAFFVSISILRKTKKNKLDISFALFWLLFSLAWFSIGSRHFFASLGLKELDRAIFVVGQIFIFLHFVPGAFYIYLKVFRKEKIIYLISLLFLIGALIGIVGIFRYGIIVGPVSDFTTEYGLNIFSSIVFKILFVFGVGLYVCHCLLYLFKWLKRKRIFETPSFLASLSVVIYGVLGYFDQTGFMSGWLLVFFRLCYLLAVFLVYLSSVLEKPSSNQ